MDLRTETFLCACRHMNYTKAAEELHITQPAVSQHIRYLEKKYGMALFTRRGKRLELTEAGRIYRDTMLTMKNDESHMLARMQESQRASRSLAFGVTMTIGEYAVVPSLSNYLKAHPDTTVHVRYANTTVLLEDMQNGQIDLALVEGYFDPAGYETMKFSQEDFVPVCAAGHHFDKEPRRMRDLLDQRLIVREAGSGTRNILERNLAVNDLSVESFRRRVEVENMHTIIGLTTRDCGITFLYRIAVEEELAQGTLRELHLEDFHMKHDFTFIWPRGSVFRQEYAAICRELGGLD